MLSKWLLLLSSLFFHFYTNAQPTKLQPHVDVLHQFLNGTWVENIIVLSNGSLLVTLLSKPSLYLIDPDSSSSLPVLVQHLPSHTSVLGIAQLAPEIVAVIARNLSSASLASIPGTYSVYLLKISESSPPVITGLFPIPGGNLLNGMTTLPLTSDYVLLADSILGIIWRLNILTGAVDQAISDLLFMRSPNNSFPALNGIHIFGDYIYFSNSNTAIFGRRRIMPDGSPTHESAEVLAQDYQGASYDDFHILPDGTVFIASPTGNAVNRITPGGDQEVLVRYVNNTQLDHPTSVQFGRGPVKGKVMYVTTAGILPGVGGSGGGQVLKVDVGWVTDLNF